MLKKHDKKPFGPIRRAGITGVNDEIQYSPAGSFHRRGWEILRIVL